MGINQTIWKNQQRIPCNVSIHWKSVAVKQAVLSALKCIIRFAELVLKGRGKSFLVCTYRYRTYSILHPNTGGCSRGFASLFGIRFP